MRTIALVVLLQLSGCAQIATQLLPSLDYCDEVVYLRKGSAITVTAHCRAPVR